MGNMRLSSMQIKKLAKTERALRGFDTDDTDPLAPRDALHEACAHLMEVLTQGTMTTRSAQLLCAMIPRLQLQGFKMDLHRTLKRCVAEARAQKRRALKVWIAAGGATPPRAQPGGANLQNPKQSQIST